MGDEERTSQEVELEDEDAGDSPVPPVDASLGLAAPLLLIIALLWVVVSVGLQLLASPQGAAEVTAGRWVSALIPLIAALFVLVATLRALPWAQRLGIPLAAVGVAVFGLWAYGALASAADGLPLLIVPPVAAFALAVAAYRVSSHAFDADDPFSIAALMMSWGLGVVAPFVVGAVVYRLSDMAGNAGMDLIAVFVAPMPAFVTWWITVLLSQLVHPRAEGQPLAPRHFAIVAAVALVGMGVATLVAARLL